MVEVGRQSELRRVSASGLCATWGSVARLYRLGSDVHRGTRYPAPALAFIIALSLALALS